MPTAVAAIEVTRTAWDAVAPGYDEHVTDHNLGLGRTVLERVRVGPGVTVLDVASGSGAVAIPAAEQGAEVTAVDLSPVMVERLARRAAANGLDNLTVHVMDGEHLSLNDATFDVTASQFGVMLFPDLRRGIAEMVRVTRPGGTVVLAVMGAPPTEVEFIGFFLAAVHPVAPEALGPLQAGPLPPFRLADAEVLRRHLTGVGLRDVRIETVDYTISLEPTTSGKDLWEVVTNSNPIGAALVAGLNDEQGAEVRRILDRMLQERVASGDAFLHSPVHVATGLRS
jgi:ubiquinone/menaquinone biosynthesis C-methylase UbiE